MMCKTLKPHDFSVVSELAKLDSASTSEFFEPILNMVRKLGNGSPQLATSGKFQKVKQQRSETRWENPPSLHLKRWLK